MSVPVMASASRDLVVDRVLHPLGPLIGQRRVLCVIRGEPQRREGLVDAGEIGLRALDRRSQDCSNTRRLPSTTRESPARTACLRGPVHHATRVPLKSRSSARAKRGRILRQRQGIRGVGAGEHAEEQRDIGHRPRHRTRHRKRRPARPAPGRDRATDGTRRRCRRPPDCAAIRRCRCHRQSEPCRTRARRPRRRCCRRRSCRGRRGSGSRRTRGLKVCDPAPNSGVLVLPTVSAPAARMRVTIRRVARRNVVVVEQRAPRRANARGFDEILVRDGQAVQPPSRSPRASASSARPRLPARARRRA